MADHPDLQHLITVAGLDDDFCERLLQDGREKIFEEFDLSEIKRQAVLSIEADTLMAFAQGLHDWMLQHPIPSPSSDTRGISYLSLWHR